MINTLSLLIGMIGLIFVVIRAFLLDRTLPWFKPPVGRELAPPPGQPRSAPRGRPLR